MKLCKFDLQRLHEALDEACCARGLSWAALAAEINDPFAGTPSIPVSLSTLRNMPKKISVTSAVVLQVLRWLKRTPESFLSGKDTGIVTDKKMAWLRQKRHERLLFKSVQEIAYPISQARRGEAPGRMRVPRVVSGVPTGNTHSVS